MRVQLDLIAHLRVKPYTTHVRRTDRKQYGERLRRSLQRQRLCNFCYLHHQAGLLRQFFVTVRPDTMRTQRTISGVSTLGKNVLRDLALTTTLY